MPSSNINYAKFVGIESLPAAIVFAILYVPLLGYFAFRAIKNQTYVLIILTLFCTIRVASFTIRAILAGSASAGGTLGLVVAEEILSGVGYFSLLYSSYNLVMDRIQLSNSPIFNLPFLRIIQRRAFFRLALLAAVILGIIAASNTTSNGPSTSSSTKALHDASTALFLALTALQAILTGVLVITARSQRREGREGTDSIGLRHGAHILLIIAILLLIREIFITATVSNARKQDNEHFWYPLVTVPEILVVLLYATPGLVPSRDEFSQHETSTSKPDA